MYDTVVKCCMDSRLTSIPASNHNVREIPGWNDKAVRLARGTLKISLFSGI